MLFGDSGKFCLSGRSLFEQPQHDKESCYGWEEYDQVEGVIEKAQRTDYLGVMVRYAVENIYVVNEGKTGDVNERVIAVLSLRGDGMPLFKSFEAIH